MTVEEIWLAAAADTPPDAASGWVKRPLPAPVTIDLAALTPGMLATLASGVDVPGGTYLQLHLVVADASDALLPSAANAGLPFNAGITLADATGATTTSPLEWPAPGAGITVPVQLDLAGSLPAALAPATTTTATGSTTTSASTGASNTTATTTSLVLAIDASRDVLSYAYGTNTGYILSAMASVADAARSGAITGQVDASALAAGHPPVSVSAEAVDASGSHHVVVARRYAAADGSFSLSPLPATAQGTTYDVVISSSGANTLVIRGVPVIAGTPGAATLLQSGAIALAPAVAVYADIPDAAPQLPGGTRVDFNQTVAAAGEVPYVVDGTAVDPLTRRLPGDSFALSAGQLGVGDYAGGGPIAFTAAAPLEGAGGYRIESEGLYRAVTFATGSAIVGGSVTSPTLLDAPYPSLAAGAIPGSITLTVATTSGQYDSGFAVISSGGRLVETADVSALLRAGGGTATVGGLPAGSALVPGAGVPYQAAIRAWNSSDPAGTLVRASAAASTSLGDAGTGAITIQLQ
jgi:hypothetical protein